MENPKTPETLDDDAVGSGLNQDQNLCSKTQEEAIDLTSKSPGGFDSNCTGEGVSNVELLNRFIDKENEIEFVNTEENQIKGVLHVDVPVPKEGSKVDAEVVAEKSAVEGSANGISLFVEVFGPRNGLVEVDKPAVLGDHVSRGISSNLVNEGNGALLSDSGENPSSEVSDIDYPVLGLSQNGTVDCEAKGENEAQEECKFSIGDLVWVKTKAQSWWPGLIFDPKYAPKDTTKSDQRASLLVKYFGNGSYVWCSRLQLKPFVDNFEEMSAEGNSMTFNGAVKKAVIEFGRRVKSQVTCSCIMKEENQTILNDILHGDSESKDAEMETKMHRIDEKSVNLFEPENFVASVKFLALDLSMPGMLEFEATRNRLHAFYRSLGHLQLPMHQLRAPTDAKDSAAEDGVKQSGDSMDRVSEKKVEGLGKVSRVKMDAGLANCRTGFSEEGYENSEIKNRSAELAEVDNCQLASPAATENKVSATANGGGSGGKSGKFYESRERRRSKYLSPPYTDLTFGSKNSPDSQENEIEGGKTVDKNNGQSVGSPSLVNSSGKKLQKKKAVKAPSKHDASGIPGGMNLSSANMLSELCFAALDCRHSDKNRHFDEVERFFSGFRRSVFHDMSNGEIDCNVLQMVPGVEVPMDKASALVGDSTESGEKKPFAGSMGTDMQERSEGLPKVTYKRRKKEMVTTSPNAIPAPGFSDLNGNPTNGSFIINFQEGGSLAPEAMSVPKKKRKRVGINVDLKQAKVAAVLPDLNGNCTIPSSLVGDSQANNLVSFADKLESKKSKNKDRIASAKTKSSSAFVDANGNPAKVGAFVKDVQVMGPCSTQDLAELHKEEGMKEASASLNSNSKSELTANQRETNGNNVDESSSFVKDLIDLLSPVGKPGPKKRKRKEKAPVDPIPDLNGNAADPISQRDNLPAGEVKPPRKKRRRNKPIAGFIPEININYNKVQTHREASGSTLLLKFAQGFPVPSKGALIATFCGFGKIKDSETQALSDSISAQVVFENSSDAGNAFKSLEKSSPFGPALIDYRLHNLPAASRASVTSKNVEGFMIPAKKPYGLKPNSGEAPDLSVIRKNLEMMTSMLEKKGNDISPETRAKLETEVKGLLKKVSTMVGSSSSAS